MNRNTSKIPKILILLLFTLLFTGCTKEKEYTYNVPDDFKAYTYFKTGSYWIYLNEKTGITDCTYISKFYSTTRVSGDNGTSDPKVTRDYTEMVFGGKLLRESVVTAELNDAMVEISPNNNYISDIGLTYSLLLDPKMSSTRYREEIYNYGISVVYPEETINGNSFSHVYNIHQDGLTDLGDSIVYDVQIVKNIGLVKIRFYDEHADTTWSLVKWKIVQ
jgi:hypothetical protein